MDVERDIGKGGEDFFRSAGKRVDDQMFERSAGREVERF